MKTFALLALIASAPLARAEEACSYNLDTFAYWKNTNGTLTMSGQEFSCNKVYLAPATYTTLCNVKGSATPATTESFNYAVAFEGGASQYFVFAKEYGDNAQAVCEGTATASDRK
jgi:hypothetical protein